jgi:signal transduction histidine kinase
MSERVGGVPSGVAEAARGESVLQRPVLLQELLDGPSFAEVVRGFCELHGVGLQVLDMRGTRLADVKGGNGAFCGYVGTSSEGRARCVATVARVVEGPVQAGQGALAVEGEPGAGLGLVTVPCFTGLRYLVLPVRWEGELLGRVVFGPFSPEEVGELPSTLAECGGLELTRARELGRQVQRVPERTAARVVAHFAQVLGALVAAGQKSHLTNQLHLEAMREAHRELEANNARLGQLNARLKELDRLKSSFLGTVSHELRTPLTSILGYAEMLTEGLVGTLNADQLQCVRTIQEKGETLQELITSMLDISQIEAGKLRLAFEPVDLGQVLATAVTSVKPQAQRRNLALEVLTPLVPPQAWADKDRLRQVVVNLLDNAVKFTPVCGRIVLRLSEVAVQPELGVPGYRIQVEDTGVGIPVDQFERIFQSFYQVDNTPSREFGGAGLGLAIVKSFVEGHGGRVSVESEHGRGSRFTLVLPARPTSAQGGVQVPPPTPPQEPDRF